MVVVSEGWGLCKRGRRLRGHVRRGRGGGGVRVELRQLRAMRFAKAPAFGFQVNVGRIDGYTRMERTLCHCG